MAKRPLTAVAVSPIDPATLVVTVSGFTNVPASGQGHVFMSTDMGAHWKDIGVGLPLDIPVLSVAFDPDAPASSLFVGTDVGVFHTADLGSATPSWTNANNGVLPKVPVYQLRTAAGKLVAATHGRGVWSFASAPTPTASTTVTPTPTSTAGVLLMLPGTPTPPDTPTATETPTDTPTATETPTETPFRHSDTHGERYGDGHRNP